MQPAMRNVSALLACVCWRQQQLKKAALMPESTRCIFAELMRAEVSVCVFHACPIVQRTTRIEMSADPSSNSHQVACARFCSCICGCHAVHERILLKGPSQSMMRSIARARSCLALVAHVQFVTVGVLPSNPLRLMRWCHPGH